MGTMKLSRRATFVLLGGLCAMAFSSVPVINPHTTEGLEARKKALSAWNRKLEQRERALRAREVTSSGASSQRSSASTSGSRSGGSSTPKEELVFEETFETLDLELWQHEITLGGGGNWEFQYYANNRTNSYVEDGVLFLQPTLTSDTFGRERVSGEVPYRLDLWGSSPGDECTSNQFYGCERASDFNIHRVLNPVQSARVRTVGTFNFKYGRLEVEAKLPRGDWLWPAIWLLPENNAYGNWPASGEIDLMESRGNAPGYAKGGVDSMSSCLHWAPFFELDAWPATYGEFKLKSGTFNDDFHIFGMVWNEDGLFTYVDSEDQKVLAVDFTKQDFWARGGFDKLGLSNPWQGRGPAAPFDMPFYLIFNVAVGGLSNFFPDGVGNKPWSNHDVDAAFKFLQAEDQWYPTWEDKTSALQIRSVRVWQTPKPVGSTSAVTDLRGHYSIAADEDDVAVPPHPASSSASLFLQGAAVGATVAVLVFCLAGTMLVANRGRVLRWADRIASYQSIST